MSTFVTVGLIAAIYNFNTLSESVVKLFNVFGKLGSYISTTINQWIEMQVNEALYIETTNAATIATNMLKLSLSALVAIIGIAVVAYNAYQQAQEQARQSAYEAEKTALSNLELTKQQLSELEKENQSREDLVKAIQAVDGSYKDEGQSLDELNKKRQESIDKIKEESKAKLEQAKNEGYETYKSDLKTLTRKGYISASTKTGTGITNNIVTGYQQQAKAYGVDFNVSNLENYLASLNRLSEYSQQTNTRIKGLSSDLAKTQQVFDEASQNVDRYNTILLNLGQVYDTVTGKIKALLPSEIAQNDAIDQFNNLTTEQTSKLDEWGISIDDISEKMDEADVPAFIEALNNDDLETARALLEKYGIEINNVADNAQDASNIWDEFVENIEGVQSAYETLTKAADEYNQNGFITASTLKKLNKLSPEYLAVLAQEGDTYANIDKALGEYLDKEKEDAITKVNLARYTAILELCEKTLKEQTDETSKTVETSGETASTASEGYNELGNAAIKAAIAMKAVEDGGLNDEDFANKFNEINNYFDGLEDAINKTNLGAVESAKSSAGSHKDAWVEAFEEEKDALKNLLETDQITEYEYYQRLAELNEKYFGEISGNHEKYIKEYRENEEEIYKGMKEVYDKVRDYLKEAVEQGYEKAINSLKKEEKAVLAEIKKQIEAIKKEKEEVIKGIEKQIKALKKEKEAIEKYYNDQIDAIKRENEVLQEQNELLEKQQELQKAKQQKVMVMQNGRFSLTENESAVSQAEQNLSNYEDQLSYEQQIQQLEDLRDAQVETIEERIEALEEYKEYMEEYYDEQIEAMEEYYDQVQEQYELQIEALQEELDTFKEGYQKEEDLENARLAAQVLGMNERKDLYAQELENLKNYINEVNRMLASLGEAGVQVDFSYSPITGYHEGIAEVAGVDMALETRASGDASFGKDSVALVGESPNAELLLGSKVNTIGGGKLMHLQKGTGVVNAESTQTLAGLLNGLATPQTNVANNRSTQQNFSFGTISLPNVTDADSFVNTLSHKFNNYAIQYGNTRK